MRDQYGAAVETAIRALQRSELQRTTKTPTPRTEPIGAARAAAQRARLLACPGQIRRAREPHEWQEMYDRAMADKRKRIADESGDVFGPKIPKPTRSKRKGTV